MTRCNEYNPIDAAGNLLDAPHSFLSGIALHIHWDIQALQIDRYHCDSESRKNNGRFIINPSKAVDTVGNYSK